VKLLRIILRLKTIAKNISNLNAIKFVASTMSHRYLDASVFKDAGISVTESILYVKHWMANCPVSHRKYKMLTVISAILCLILDKELASFRLYLLRTLRRFVEHLLQVDIFRKHASLISGELSRIFVCILEVHNNAQTAFFNVCTARQDEKSIDTAQYEGDSYWMMLKSNRTRASLNTAGAELCFSVASIVSLDNEMGG
jgi:hypothetical protein